MSSMCTARVWGCPGGNGNSASEENSATAKTPSPKRPREAKMLEISRSMNPQYISFQIFVALSSSSYNGLSCHGLDLIDLENKGDGPGGKAKSQDDPASIYLDVLRTLIKSRKWLRLEFHRCIGVESLFWMPTSEGNNGDLEATRVPVTTEVDTLILKFHKSSQITCCSFDESRHSDFFVHLWDHWKVRRLSLSMDFTTKWAREFCRRKVSLLESLDISPECTWHQMTKEETKSPDGTGAALNEDDDNSDHSEQDDGHTSGGGWKLFCRRLRINHPRIRSLEIRCKTRDDELAYLIDHAIAPASVASSDPQTPLSVLPIEKLFFGKWCSCDEMSLRALSHVLVSSVARGWKSLTLSRGVKLPSRAALEIGTALPSVCSALLEFCRGLQQANALTKMELGDFMFGENELGALFESLVLASGKIEKLLLFSCATTSPDVYERVLCGSICSNENSRLQAEFNRSSTSCQILNRLPYLRSLYLPKEASKVICHVLKSNTSIEWINTHGRTKTHEYHLDLNRGGRRILTTASVDHCDSVSTPSTADLPSSLWPTILERASSDPRGIRRVRYCGGMTRKYDVMYCLLRNRILLECRWNSKSLN